ncbi:MAG: type II secretion system F family protein [Candidatus Omnitrophica bacterium]|nr:type II secretion system F family protein [Candidatus Omnitrophota bacterium]
MPKFRYRARDRFGSLLAGTVQADGRMVLAQNLKRLGYNVISISEPHPIEKAFDRFTQRIRGIPRQEVLVVTRQLGAMLGANIPILTALESCAEQTPIDKLRQILRHITDEIRAGRALSQALALYPKIFSNLFINLVQVGENTGGLDESLTRLSELGTREQQLRAKVRSAFTYPIVLLLAGIAVVVFLLVRIIPQFSQIFLSSDVPLPLPTKILLSFSGFLQTFWWLILIALLAAGFALRRLWFTETGRYYIGLFFLRLPIGGDLILKAIIASLTRSLAVLIRSGVPILQALKIVEQTMDNLVIVRVLQNVQGQITEGKKLTEPLAMSGFFPPMVIQMLSAGEDSGKLDQMLTDIADFYDIEVTTTVDNLTSLLEPVLLLMMGGVVAFIALSVLLPIFNLVKVFRK